ncbi:ribosome recycling factor [Candidatus Saccharibacteria bacterium]|nr:ribosome recycling factor [Candidatus Saccharibacteria bacterium]
MTPQSIFENAKKEFEKAEVHFRDECKKLRTGRAHPSMIEDIKISAYGVPTPLAHLATVTTPEAQLIQVSPFDPNNLQAISDAIRNDQALGFNPTDDGRVVRIPVPPLTTERRQQVVKQLGEKKEECFVTMRQARHDAMDKLKKLKSDKEIGEDEQQRAEKQVDDEMNRVKSSVEATAKSKEAEIMTV